MRKVVSIGLLTLLVGASGCSFFGLFGPKGPRTITVLFSNETVGELKPCG